MQEISEVKPTRAEVLDLYQSLHSFRTKVTFLKTDTDTIVQHIQGFIKHADSKEKYSLSLCDFKTGFPNTKCAALTVIKRSPHGFRDKIDISLYPYNSADVCVDIWSRSIDPHMWSAICKCTPILSWFFCCCGLFPTSDHGENRRFILEFLERLDLPFLSGDEATKVEAKNSYLSTADSDIDDKSSSFTELINVSKE